jgi:hypothetical protein
MRCQTSPERLNEEGCNDWTYRMRPRGWLSASHVRFAFADFRLRLEADTGLLNTSVTIARELLPLKHPY